LPGVIETVTAVNEVGAISGIEPQREILFGEMFGTSNAFDRPGGSFDLGSWMAAPYVLVRFPGKNRALSRETKVEKDTAIRIVFLPIYHLQEVNGSRCHQL
jgi:hypothetical protein